MGLEQVSKRRRPRLKRTVEQVDSPDGDIFLMRVVGEDVQLGEVTDQDRRLLDALDGSRTLTDLAASFGATKVAEVLGVLERWNVLEDADDEAGISASQRERLDRQLRYFSEAGTPGGPSPRECLQRLSEARVAVLGAGGLGGRIAYELAA